MRNSFLFLPDAVFISLPKSIQGSKHLNALLLKKASDWTKVSTAANAMRCLQYAPPSANVGRSENYEE